MSKPVESQKPLTSLQRIMAQRGIEKANRNTLAQQNSNQNFKGSPMKSYRNASFAASGSSKRNVLGKGPTLKFKEEEGAEHKHEIFARSALIQSSFFPKESRPLTRSPIYRHSPFLNKMLLFDHQAAGKKKKKPAAAGLTSKIGYAMERKFYNADIEVSNAAG